MIVEVKVMSRERNTLIEVVGEQLLVNGKKKDVDTESFLRRLFCIVASWEQSMVNLSVLDGESYSVKIDDGQNKVQYVGKNKFPSNYSKFVSLINEVL